MHADKKDAAPASQNGIPKFDFSFGSAASLDKPASAPAWESFSASSWNFSASSAAGSQNDSSSQSSTPAWAESYAPTQETFVPNKEVEQLLSKEPPKTGEEGEKTIAQVMAKLYQLGKKEEKKDEEKEASEEKKEEKPKDESKDAMEWREL